MVNLLYINLNNLFLDTNIKTWKLLKMANQLKILTHSELKPLEAFLKANKTKMPFFKHLFYMFEKHVECPSPS